MERCEWCDTPTNTCYIDYPDFTYPCIAYGSITDCPMTDLTGISIHKVNKSNGETRGQ